MTHLLEREREGQKDFISQSQRKVNLVVGNRTKPTWFFLSPSSSSTFLSFCVRLCVFWGGVPNGNGKGGGSSMSCVVVVNCSEMAYRMNKLENWLLWISTFCYIKQTRSLSFVIFQLQDKWLLRWKWQKLIFMSNQPHQLQLQRQLHSLSLFACDLEYPALSFLYSILLADNRDHYSEIYVINHFS